MITALALIAFLQAAPGAQVMGPSWVDQRVDVRGQVIAVDGGCFQLAVDRAGIIGAGGRLWACGSGPTPDLNTDAHVRGVVSDTRMTRVGPAWRPVPVVVLEHFIDAPRSP
jgi:hypothetical protein